MAKDNFFGSLLNVFGSEKKWLNMYNKSLFQFIGGQTARYDYNDKTYLEKGYGENPDVFAVINQMCDKTKAVPYAVKRVKDEQSLYKLSSLRNATNGNYSTKQLANKILLESKAYEDKEMPFPLEKPNPNQTWGDIRALFKLYFRTLGNSYIFMIWPEDGENKGRPRLVYVLPSHKVKILIKDGADLMNEDDPIEAYLIRDGDDLLRFPAEQVIHIKTPNPFFNMNGSHLYGLSPMKALLKNIESSNGALNNNVQTINNAGVFGFFSGKEIPLNQEQIDQLKLNLVEMDKNPGRLSKIGGTSVPIEFTRLSLNTSELQPFEFLKHDQKTICNVLGWSDALLNNDDGGKYDKQKEERKRVITDNIQPDLILFDQAMTDKFIRRFKGYENAVLEHDITELPEMQEDYKIMLEWMEKAYYTPNEIRTATKAESLNLEGMSVPWIDGGKKRIDEVGITASDVQKSYEYLKNDIV